MKTLDLNTEFPRSPRQLLAGYVIAARALDKCRAVIAGTQGEYHFACPLDNIFFDFTGIKADEFKEFVACGAGDDAVGAWIEENSQVKERCDLIQWNNDLRYKRISEMPVDLQEFLETYIPEFVPAGKFVNYWFDIYDIEEGRM